MKKNIEWLKDEILNDMRYLEGNREIQQLDIKYQTLREVAQKINSLDEPETLSEEWIEEHEYIRMDPDNPFVYVKDLQNLIVPKKEYAVEKQVETVASVIDDFFKSAKRMKEVLDMEVEELEE